MKISTILRKAANEKLWDGESPNPENALPTYSCTAIARAAGRWDHPAEVFYRELGVPFCPFQAFGDVPSGASRQGARYMMLMFAALYAKSEGL